MTDDEETTLILRMVDELRDYPNFELGLNSTAAVQLAGLLQLVLRHPTLPPSNRQTAIQVLDLLRMHFADAPACLQAIDQGGDPRHDRPPHRWRP